MLWLSGLIIHLQWVNNPIAAAQFTAVAQIQSLAQEIPYAVSAAIKIKIKKILGFQ